MDQVGEAELLAAATAGQVLVCGDGRVRRSISADLLRRCCRELRYQVDPRGVRLRGAEVTGSLDLAGLDVPFPLRFDGCSFASLVTVEGAQLAELVLTGCDNVPGLLANGVRIRRDLDLSRSHVTGALETSASTSKLSAIWLCESEIGGRLLCVDTVIHGGDRSIQADRLHVLGNVRLLHGFTAHGEVRLIGARIGGSLDLTGASIESPGTGLALDLGEAVIEASLFLIDAPGDRRPLIRGRIDMGQARIGGQFLVRNATLEARAGAPVGSAYSRSRAAGTALSAPRLLVGAELTFDGTCQVTGGIDLSMSQLGSVSVSPGCSLTAPGRTALDLTNTELLSTFTVGEQVPVQGTVRLSGARIHGNLRLRGAVLSAPEGRSLLAAQGVTVDGAAELQNVQATGGDLGFRAAIIGSYLDAAGAKLHNPGGYTMDLVQANVKGSVRLVDGFESTGEVVLNRAAIEGRLICTDGTFHQPGPQEPGEEPDAIEAISATIRSGMDLGWESISPRVDFTNTRTSFLADDPEAWPSRYVIVGFIYDRFELPQGAARRPLDHKAGAGQRPQGAAKPPWDHQARAAWLNRQAVYDAGPYEQAARVFREHGYTAGAEAILIASRQHARRVIGGRARRLRQGLDRAYSITVGYGHRPGRVLWLLAVLLALVIASLEYSATQATMRATTPAGLVFSTHGPAPGAGLGGGLAQIPAARSDACGGGEVRCFNPVLYAIDTVVPLVSLEQRSTWYPDPNLRYGAFMQWWLNAATLLGWLLSSIFVLSLARLSRAT
jgi:hypothetical protein